MRRTRIGLVGIVLLTAAAIGESLAFIGSLFGAPNLAWIGYAIVIAPVLFVVAKLLHTPKDITNTVEGFDRSLAPDVDSPDFPNRNAGESSSNAGGEVGPR